MFGSIVGTALVTRRSSVLGIAALLAALQTRAAVAQLPPTAAEAKRIAAAMVASTRAYRWLTPGQTLPFLEDPKFPDLAQVWSALVGAALDSPAIANQPRYLRDAKLVFVARGWLVGKARFPKYGDLSRYVVRANTLPAASYVDWYAQSEQLGLFNSLDAPAFLVLALAFLDPLWDGVVFRADQSQKALARLATVSRETISEWEEATSSGQMEARDSKLLAAYSLLNVDSLFQVDAFQVQRFEAALPAAKIQIAASPPWR